MPRIPEYHAQITYEGQQTPRVSASAAGNTGEMLAHVGEDAFRLGMELDQKLATLKQLEELSTLTLDAEEKLHAMHHEELSAPEFVSDPEGAPARFKTRVGKLRTEFERNIKDREVLTRWKSHFGRLAMSGENSLRDAARKKRIDSGQATIYTSLARLANIAGQANSGEAFDNYINRGVQLIQAGAAAQAFSLDHAARLQDKWVAEQIANKARWDMFRDPVGAYERLEKKEGIYRRLNDDEHRGLLELAAQRRETHLNRVQVETERMAGKKKEALVNNAYAGISSFMADDPQGAADWLRKPGNAETYGLTDADDIRKLIGWFESDAARQRKDYEEAQKARQEAADGELLKQFSAGKLTPAMIEASGLDAKRKEHWHDKLNQAAQKSLETDPRLYGEIVQKIYRREIKDKSQIVDMIGKGLSGKHAEELVRSLPVAEDPMKSKYFSMGVDLFKRKYKEDPELSAREPEFAFLLDQVAKKQGLKAEEIYLKAQELMTPMEDARKEGLLGNLAFWTDPPARWEKMKPPLTFDEEPPAASTSNSTAPSQNTPESPAAQPPSLDGLDDIPDAELSRIITWINQINSKDPGRIRMTGPNIRHLYEKMKGGASGRE